MCNFFPLYQVKLIVNFQNVSNSITETQFFLDKDMFFFLKYKYLVYISEMVLNKVQNLLIMFFLDSRCINKALQKKY